MTASRATPLTFIDVFAGCGGLASGFLESGFEPVGAVEVDRDAAQTYALNIDKRIFQEPVADVNRRREWPHATVVVGGPPCQGFSQLGTRNPRDPRSRLWRDYLAVLDLSHAQFFVMENVPRMLASRQYRRFREEAAARHFRVIDGVLNAADFGVPQVRRRAIVFGWKRGEPRLPVPTHGEGLLAQRTVRDALCGLPLEPNDSKWHRARPKVRDESVIRYRAVPANGGNRFQMQAALEAVGKGKLVPNCWRRKTAGTTDVFGRLWWDRPSVTIRTEFYKPEKGRYLHPEADRAITVREAARLQSFDDDFEFPAEQSMVSVARQIGNAVPPLLAFALADCVAAQLQRRRARLEVPELVSA